MARYIEYENKIEMGNTRNGSSSNLSSGFDKVYGIMPLFGFRVYLFPSKCGFIDFYTGFGYRYKENNTQYKSRCHQYNGPCNSDELIKHSDDSQPFEKTYVELPTMHMGVDLGFNF